MQKKLLSVGIGLSVVSTGAIAPWAIADDSAPSTRAMSDLPLPALAAPLPSRPDTNGQRVAQSLPPDRFSDVSPNHWAYTAVNTLAADYGCVSGYPDGTFRGEEFVTRYEFAAALEACLDSLVQVIDQPQSLEVDQILNDLEALDRELGTLSDDLDASESNLAPD